MSARFKKGISIFRLFPPIVVRTHRYGRLHLRRMSVSDADTLAALDSGNVDDREFVVLVIHNQLRKPALSQEEIRSWKDQLLLRVMSCWLRNEDSSDSATACDSQPTFTTLRMRVGSLLDDHKAKIHAAIERMTATHRLMEGIEAQQRLLAPIREMLEIGASLKHATPLLNLNAAVEANSLLNTVRDLRRATKPFDDMAALARCSLANRVHTVEIDQAFLLAAAKAKALESLRGGEERKNLLAWHQQMRADAERWQSYLKTIEPSRGLVEVMQAGDKASLLARTIGDISGSQQQLRDMFRQMSAAVLQMGRLDLPRFDLNLPHIDWDAAHAGQEALQLVGYGFLEENVSIPFLVALGHLEQAAQIRELQARLYAVSLLPGFGQRYEVAVRATPYGEQRWGQVSQGLICHQQGLFFASISAMCPVIEGLLTVLMEMRGEAVLHNTRLCAGDGTGALVLNVHGNPIVLTGLAQKMTYLQPEPDDVLFRIKEYINDSFRVLRNEVLHGSRTDFGDPILSTQLLWLVYVLSYRLAEEWVYRGASAADCPIAIRDERIILTRLR